MKKILTALVVMLGACAQIAQAQSKENPTTSIIIKSGWALTDTSNTYNFAEIYQTRGRWIYPDTGYVDFSRPSLYREIFIGGGAILANTKHITLIQEAYFSQATGPLSNGAMYFQPFTLLLYRITPRLGGMIIYFPYLPLNTPARVQHVLETAKIEYDFKHCKIGAGYGGYKHAQNQWQNKPFITTTLKAGRFGALEFWLQKLPGHRAQVQIRYSKNFR